MNVDFENGNRTYESNSIAPEKPSIEVECVTTKNIFIASICLMLFVLLVKYTFVNMQLSAVVMTILFFATPIGLFIAYRLVIKETIASLSFKEGGLLSWFFSRRILVIVFSCIIAPILSMSVVTQILFMEYIEFISLLFIYVVFILSNKYSRRIVLHESVDWASYSHQAWINIKITFIFIFLIHVSFLYFYSSYFQCYDSLSDALAKHQSIFAECNAVTLLYKYASYISAAKSFFICELSKSNVDNVSQFILILFLTMANYTSLVFLLAFFSIPLKEYKRIFKQKTVYSLEIPSLNGVEFFLSSFICILLLGIYISFFVAFDRYSRSSEFVNFEQKASSTIENTVFRIGDDFYAGSIMAARDKIDAIYGARLEDARRRLLEANSMMCDIMRRNVDTFLDWYYSLPAEYARLGNTLIGNGEQYLQERMTEYIGMNLEMAGRSEAEQSLVSIQKEWEQKLNDLLEDDKYKVVAPQGRATNVTIPKTTFLQSALKHSDLITIQYRFGASAGAAAIAGGVAASVIAKPAGKMAATAIAKLFAAKTATGTIGSVGGAAIGASVGSVVPVVGTAAGAVVGGFIGGITTWLATDAIVLKLEEIISREDFRHDIIEEINKNCI